MLLCLSVVLCSVALSLMDDESHLHSTYGKRSDELHNSYNVYVHDVYTILVMKLPHVYAVQSQCTPTPCLYHPVGRQKTLKVSVK